MSALSRSVLVAACLAALGAGAQDRPDESALFGTPAETRDAGPPQGVPAPPPTSRDAQELAAAHPERDAFASGESVENPLQIGGIFYQRAYLASQQGVALKDTSYAMPLQVNAFLDARPNDRVRGYVLARLQYDPTLDGCSAPSTSPVLSASAPCPDSSGAGGIGGGNGQTSSTSSAPTTFGSGTVLPSNPSVLLDQAWLKFDIEHTVFITLGKQHVKWGASRFWNPTDFLHTQKRDPLTPYDLRLGNAMAKFEVPWEAQAANFYAVGLFDNPQPASTLGFFGGAFRFEKVFGKAELGAEAVLRRSAHPVFGADFSAPVGPFDVRVEASFRQHADNPIYQLNLPPGVDLTGVLNGGPLPTGLTVTDIQNMFQFANPVGNWVQVSGGLDYSFGYMDNRVMTVGAEYFYNSLGYNSRVYYPFLIPNGLFLPFYTGQHYGALYATAEGPDQFKHTAFTVSNIGNFSDLSFITRVDFSWRILTYLTFESYADVHYGNQGGEFRFSLNVPALGTLIPYIPPPTFDLGVGFRFSI